MGSERILLFVLVCVELRKPLAEEVVEALAILVGANALASIILWPTAISHRRLETRQC